MADRGQHNIDWCLWLQFIFQTVRTCLGALSFAAFLLRCCHLVLGLGGFASGHVLQSTHASCDTVAKTLLCAIR